MKQAEFSPVWGGGPIGAVLFDLDGTLCDTASDIARALNRTLADRGWEPLPVTQVARMIGRGSPILIDRAAAVRGHALHDAERAAMVEQFFHHYGALEERNESDATAYPGVTATLRRLHESGMPMGVVTNKQRRFAYELLRRLELAQWIRVVVGGDTCERRKPDPQPLLFACESLGVAPARALMVGDSSNDVIAARAAQIPIVCVPYGYNEGQDPQTLACDAMIESLADLPGLLYPEC